MNPDNDNSRSETRTKILKGTGIAAATVVGGIGMVASAPVILTGMGFTSAGISASSMASSMMSAAAMANGGGVAAGGVVATLQSIGAAGLGTTGTAVVAGTGSLIGGVTGYISPNLFRYSTSSNEEAVDGNEGMDTLKSNSWKIATIPSTIGAGLGTTGTAVIAGAGSLIGGVTGYISPNLCGYLSSSSKDADDNGNEGKDTLNSHSWKVATIPSTVAAGLGTTGTAVIAGAGSLIGGVTGYIAPSLLGYSSSFKTADDNGSED